MKLNDIDNNEIDLNKVEDLTMDVYSETNVVLIVTKNGIHDPFYYESEQEAKDDLKNIHEKTGKGLFSPMFFE